MRRLFCKAALVGLAMLAPAVLMADDQDTAQAVAGNLKGNLKNYSVGVKVKDGTAWLNGTVASPGQMAAALEIANQTEGVDRVVNNLTIAGSGPSSRAVPSNLRQPNGVANAIVGGNRQMNEDNQEYSYTAGSSRRGQVVQAGAQLPDHAQQELLVAGPIPDMDDSAPQAGSGNQASYTNQNRMAARSPSANPGRLPQGNTAMPLAMAAGGPMPARSAAMQNGGGEMIGTPQPMPTAMPMGPGSPAPYHYDSPSMPGYAWPSYAAYPNYAAVTYPKQYSPTAWPYIGPFYPYPQVPLGWRKVTMEWKDGWWFLDFKDSH
jgi:hypothetical protein